MELTTRPNGEAWSELDEDHVRMAIHVFANQDCCFGKRPARDMDIRNIFSSSFLLYEIWTWVESRTKAWATRKYDGVSQIDGIDSGNAPPKMWSIKVDVTAHVNRWKDGSFAVKIPHTDSLVQCDACAGNGQVACEECNGSTDGMVKCKQAFCDEGNTGPEWSRRRCSANCNNGRIRCPTCKGNQVVGCKTCNARGEVIKYSRMTVTMSNHISEAKCDDRGRFGGLPLAALKKAEPTKLMEEHGPLQPISAYPQTSLEAVSKKLIDEHKALYDNGAGKRIEMQWHQVKHIPATVCETEFKETTKTLFVFGFNNEVYFEGGYYSTKCGCCTLI